MLVSAWVRVCVHGCLCVSAHVCACTYRRECPRTSMLSRKKVYPESLRWCAIIWLTAAAEWLALTPRRQGTTAGLLPLTVTPVLVRSTRVFLPLTPCIRLELALTVHWAHLLLAFILSQVFLELAFPRRGSLFLDNPLIAHPQSCCKKSA